MGRYKAYWEARLDPSKGDLCVSFDIHNTGGKVQDFKNKQMSSAEGSPPNLVDIFEKCGTPDFDFENISDERGLICLDPIEYEKQALCPDLFARLSVFTSGRIALCSADQAEYHPIGNVLDFNTPEELYNSPFFQDYRSAWLNREVTCKKNCAECTITISRFNKHAS